MCGFRLECCDYVLPQIVMLWFMCDLRFECGDLCGFRLFECCDLCVASDYLNVVISVWLQIGIL